MKILKKKQPETLGYVCMIVEFAFFFFIIDWSFERRA